MDHELREYVDKAKIQEAVQLYCRAVDRGDQALLRSIYHEDAREEHGIFSGAAADYCQFVMDFVDRAGVSAHHITNCNVALNGDTAICESYFFAVHCDIPLPEGGLTDLLLGGRYLDRFERRGDGAWKIAHRKAVYDWNHVAPFAARWDGPFFELWRPRGSVGGTDPSFDFFSRHGAALKRG